MTFRLRILEEGAVADVKPEEEPGLAEVVSRLMKHYDC